MGTNKRKRKFLSLSLLSVFHIFDIRMVSTFLSKVQKFISNNFLENQVCVRDMTSPRFYFRFTFSTIHFFYIFIYLALNILLVC